MSTTSAERSADTGSPPAQRSAGEETTGSNTGIRLTVATYINAHKVLVVPVVVGLMWYYDNWSAEAYIYLAMHGTYSILWLLKHSMYADRRFEEKRPLWFGVPFIFVPLAGYYAAPYLLISSRVTVPPPVIALALSIYILGVFYHYVSDAQKYYTLQIRKGLITNGLFSRTRNPNYLGEILIYTGYAILSCHWLPFLVLAGWVFGFFGRNMLAKDRSMSRYPDFAEYRNRTGLLFPRLW
jgi:protein-S-isoprenylcysteine O-methyltransferase Ste14